MATYKVGYFVGSLSSTSINRLLAKALVKLAPPELVLSELCFCNSPLMNQVEAYVQFKPGLITADGEVTDAGTKQFLQTYMTELHAFIVRVLTVLPRQT